MSPDERKSDQRQTVKEPAKDKSIQDLPEKSPTPATEKDVRGGRAVNLDNINKA